MENIKESVKERYGLIAASPSRPSCCGSDTVEIQITKTDNELPDVHIADLGLGCGSPTTHAEIIEGMTVLDLGSGAGIDVFLASKHVGKTGKVIGVDFTKEMLARANENALKLGIKNVEFRTGDIEQLPVEDNSVDLVISNCVINLVPDKAAVFSEIYRVLKPGGYFVISDMVTEGTIPDEIRNNAKLWSSCIAGAIDKNQYINIIKTSGFTNTNILKLTKNTAFPSEQFDLFSMTIKGIK